MLHFFKQFFGVRLKKSDAHDTQQSIQVSRSDEEKERASIELKNKGDAYLDQDDLINAAGCYQQAVAINSLYAAAHSNLGFVFAEQKQYAMAKKHLQQAVLLNPKSFNSYYILGTVAHQLGQLDQAIEQFKQAVEIKPNFAEGWDYLGTLLRIRGAAEESVDCHRNALLHNPSLDVVHSNLLLTLQYRSKLTQSEMYQEHVQFAENFEKPLLKLRRPHTNEISNERRLKIGYVSADFKRHSVALFMLPVLAHHDKKKFEIYCYFNSATGDETTDQFTKIADHFISCVHLSDDELNERVRSDGIDILVDLSGHTAGNRLLTFARKPAPIQVTYLGDTDTSGLDAMDYRLTNSDADPAENDLYYSEKLYRFEDRVWWCFRPAPNLPAVTSLPARSNGFVTFVSTNHVAKISLLMIAAWAAILRETPTAKLVLMGIPEGLGQQTIQANFLEYGVDNHRLIFHGFMSLDHYRNILIKTDISLDTFPFNGGTTTCETLYLGLPVVTMIGQSFVSRMGFSLLKEIGLPELVATNYEEYTQVAIELARDIDRLAALRSEMRDRIKRSSLSDESGFVTSLECAYRDMWDKYITYKTPEKSKFKNEYAYFCKNYQQPK